jgi:hypothetical protein
VFLVGIEPIGRLVQDEHVGIMNDRLGEAGAVTKAFGKRVNALVEHGFQEAHLHRPVDGPLLGVPSQAAQFCSKAEESMHGHIGVSRGVLRQVPDQRLAGIGSSTMSNPPTHRARSGRDKSCNHAHGSRFSSAVGAEKAENLASFHGERDVVHGQLRTKRLGQILNFNHSQSFIVSKLGVGLTWQILV